MNVRPDIAQSWDYNDSTLTYKFNLREDVYFHKSVVFANKHKDSTRIATAYDFEYSFNRLLDEKVAARGRWVLNNVKKSSPLDRDLLFMQEGRKVFKEVVPMVSQLITDHIEKEKIKTADIKRLWLHQANKSMNDFIGKKVLGRAPEDHEQPNILQDYANTSSAGSIIAFSLYSEDMKNDEIGVLCSFGAGYSAGSIILKKIS